MFRNDRRPILHRLAIAADLEIALGEDGISGFILRHPARYLTEGWKGVERIGDDAALGPVLATYIHLLDDEFVDRLEDADPAARREVEMLRERTRQLPPSPQRDVLLDALDAIIDTFFGAS